LKPWGEEECVMQCPACGNALSELPAGGVKVDACVGGCGGIWFGQLELRRFDETHEDAGEALLDIEYDESVHVNTDERRKCPACTDMVLMRLFYSPKRQVQVDHCPNCGGHWLDVGELRMIRQAFASADERRAQAEEIFAERFGAEIEAMKANRAKAAKSFSPTVSIFRFLFP